MIYLLIFGITLFIGVILGIYINLNSKQKKNIIRIRTAESEIDKNLEERKDLLVKIENIINKNTELNQNNFKELDTNSVSNFELDRLFTKISNTFEKIKTDYQIELDLEEFRSLMTELKMNEEKNEASKTYYNKYAKNLNEQISGFPANIIAKLHKTVEKETYDVNQIKFSKNDIILESKI